MNDFTGRVKREEWQPPAGLKRTLVVALDTAQYQLDMEAMQASGSEDVYSTFNLLVRRKPKVGVHLHTRCLAALFLHGSWKLPNTQRLCAAALLLKALQVPVAMSQG